MEFACEAASFGVQPFSFVLADVCYYCSIDVHCIRVPCWLSSSLIISPKCSSPLALNVGSLEGISHGGSHFNVCGMLLPCRPEPIVQRYWSRIGSFDNRSAEGFVQSSAEHEQHSLGIVFPSGRLSEVFKCSKVGVEVIPLHLEG